MMHPDNPFGTVTLPFLDSLYRTAFRMVHDQAIAELCVERTYTEARKSFHNLSEKTDFRRWMFSVLFAELHRRKKAWLHIRDWFTGTRAAQNDFAGSDDPGRVRHQGEMLGALDFIPEIFREVLLLADVQGFSQPEIQSILHISPGLVASRLSEARARLQAGLPCGGPAEPPFLEDPAVAQARS
jgi:RNA polymerase sigma-70 factor (ECF subfamily)